MREEGTKVYIYGLINKENQIFYIGKSTAPKTRLYTHSCDLNYSYLKMEILDIFYDREVYWIEKCLEEGHPIKNKEIISTLKQWEVGHTFEIVKKAPKKVMYDGVIYNSLNHLRNTTLNHISEYHLKQIIKNPKHYLATHYPITLI